MNRSIACFKAVVIFTSLLLVFSSCSKRSGDPRVLVFTKTTGYHHESIVAGIAAIEKLGNQQHFQVDTTTNANWFTEDSLQKYAAVVFLSTTGDVLDHYQEAEFERYIQAGGGFMGIHAAADCEYDWGWYGRLVGGYFTSHPGITDSFKNIQPGVLNIVDGQHISTKHLTKQWNRTDEFYSFKKLNKEVKVLITVDEKSYRGGKNGDYHPMAWYHEYDGGRAFYTNLGHTTESFSEAAYLTHILGGIQYAIGDNNKLNYSKATTLRVPDENRFNKIRMVNGQFYEPMEMTILPNLDILVAQRRGEIMLYKQGDSIIKQIGFLNVYYKTNNGANAEEGLLGIKIDPDFKNNHYVFIFYSPSDTSVNRLSRFTFTNDKIDLTSEKIVLQLYSQREICCHTGGSIAFDKDGLLCVSTGDNSTPFNEPKQPFINNGYAPLDDRPGHEQYDARRSSGNANDLRGKILRIRVKADGTYEIPEGNLYPKGTVGTRPEIYVQGNRNPFRISIDQKNNFLYWGEVGPDAGTDSFDLRGPRGYDEVNQARKAGFFGWPLFVGNNYPYHVYNYSNGKSGDLFDPAKPVNASLNNTGITLLPPAQPAFIWYPYANSKDFPQTGAGGRNAMAGPVYYTDMYPEETRLPDYYNKKLFIYDWIRGWIKVVSMQPNGDFDKMEPFMEKSKFKSVIDMEVGPDGKLYLLEYGDGWFTKNSDAGLSRVDFNPGNRSPKINSFTLDQSSGSLPFSIQASAEATDPENDQLRYVWNLGNGITKETTEPALKYTYDKPGDYAISVSVSDGKGASSKSKEIAVYAGNKAPVVKFVIPGNKTFYFLNKPVSYSLQIDDKEDPSAIQRVENIFISADYIEGSDKASASLGHQVMTEAMVGKSLIESNDCKSCHKQAEKSIGPSFLNVATRYQKDPVATANLANKIIKGGSGVWGEVAMAAHPNLKEAEAKQIVAWIQTLAGNKQIKKSLAISGSINATLGKASKQNGMLVLSATYIDKAAAGLKSLSAIGSVALKNPLLNFEGANNLSNFTSTTIDDNFLLIVPKVTGSFSLDNIDLSGITSADLTTAWEKAPTSSYHFEIHVDSPDGTKIGEASLEPGKYTATKLPEGRGLSTSLHFNLRPISGKLHNLYIVSKPDHSTETNALVLSTILFSSK